MKCIVVGWFMLFFNGTNEAEKSNDMRNGYKL